MKEEKFHPTKIFALLGDEVIMLDVTSSRYFAFNIPGALLYNQLQMRHRDFESLYESCNPAQKEFLQTLEDYKVIFDEPIPIADLMKINDTTNSPSFRCIGDVSACTFGVSPPGSVLPPSGS